MSTISSDVFKRKIIDAFVTAGATSKTEVSVTLENITEYDAAFSVVRDFIHQWGYGSILEGLCEQEGHWEFVNGSCFTLLIVDNGD